jgi:predicted PurR-regulated permease PerM
VVFVLLAIALIGTGFFIIQPLAAELREFTANWGTYQTLLLEKMKYFQDWYASLPEDVRLWVERQETSDAGARFGEQLQHLVQRTLESGMLLVEMILIPVLAFSFLTESRPLKREFVALLPYNRVRDGLYVIRQTGRILQSYAVGQLILALIAGGVVYLLMMVMGIRYALALAVIAAITRVIPVVGPIFGGIPIVLLATLQGWDRGLTVLIVFSLMHLVESKVVMPKLIGYRIKLHPAVVIIVLLIGAEFFGVWGMFLAAPVAAVIRTLLHHFVVRPRLRGRTGPPSSPTVRRGTSSPNTNKESQVELPAVAGARRHSGAH